MSEPTALQQLAQEMWTSLASLLRSHVAMHSIAHPGGGLRVIASSGSMLEVLGAGGKLTVLGPGESGFGSMEFRPEFGELSDEYAAFFFTDDGLMQWEGAETPVNVEGAVEHWLSKVRG